MGHRLIDQLVDYKLDVFRRQAAAWRRDAITPAPRSRFRPKQELRMYDSDPVTIYRHKKRGTEYVLVGYGKMQAEHWRENDPNGGHDDYVSVDMREVAIYRSATDPTEIWVRPREAFEDGRFEIVTRGV